MHLSDAGTMLCPEMTPPEIAYKSYIQCYKIPPLKADILDGHFTKMTPRVTFSRGLNMKNSQTLEEFVLII